MVEQGIYFALGCIVTALCALMFAPVFWRRALRLTRQRLQLQVPLSMQEILAERDQLRAEFAVERLRVEQASARVQASKDADMVEIGRRSMEAGRLTEQGAALTQQIADLTRDLAEAGTENGALKLEMTTAHREVERWQATAQAKLAEGDQLRDEMATRAEASAAEADRLRDALETHRTTIAGLETRTMGHEMRLTDFERDAVRLKGHLEAAKGHATRHETSAIALRRECDDAKARVRSLETELEAIRDRQQSQQLQASLLKESRAGAPLPHDEPSLDASADDELRASIHALGLAVAMMTRQANAPPTDPGATGLPLTRDMPSRIDAI